MSVSHANISIFVPHIGCPNKCSFCDQTHITGTSQKPTASDVTASVKTAVNSKNFDGKNTEIAFFGGSFTAIDREYMSELLSAAYGFVKDKTVCGIRISTRPDAIDSEVLQILKSYGVTSIELGAQSLDDDVLKLNDRGHTATDVFKASALIKSYGFSLGLQMMTGLYGDTNEKSLETLEKIISLQPDTLRIYPTIVLKDTRLASLVKSGKYRPQTLDEAVLLCSALLERLSETNIKLIRLGLHTIEENGFVAGPWHPAFSELCYSRLVLNKLKKMLSQKGKYIIHVRPYDVSKTVGQKRSNINELLSLGFECKVVGDNYDENNDIIIERGDS